MNNRPDLTTQIEALIDRLMKGDESDVLNWFNARGKDC